MIAVKSKQDVATVGLPNDYQYLCWWALSFNLVLSRGFSGGRSDMNNLVV